MLISGVYLSLYLMSRPWELCRVCSLISRINFRSRSKAGKIKFFLPSGSSPGLGRPELYIGPGAWGRAEPRAWRCGAASPPPGRAGPPVQREARCGLGNPGGFQRTPSQALPGRLGLGASSARKTFPLRFLGASCAVRRGSRCGWKGRPDGKVRFDLKGKIEFRV